MKQQHSDEEIIEHLCSGQLSKYNAGIEMLYLYFFPMVARFILSNNGTKEDAEDIFQEGIIAFFNQIKGGDLALKCKLKTYCYSICRNLWLKKIKLKKPDTLHIEDREEFIKMDADFFKTIELNEEKRAMLELINQLGGDCKTLLTYFYYERLEMKEIAFRMNFASDQVARNKKVKCLRKLTSLVDASSFFKQFFLK